MERLLIPLARPSADWALTPLGSLFALSRDDGGELRVWAYFWLSGLLSAFIAAFGAPRCMLESNFPVDQGSYGYAAFRDARKILEKYASTLEKTDLFSGPASRVYRLGI